MEEGGRHVFCSSVGTMGEEEIGRACEEDVLDTKNPINSDEGVVNIVGERLKAEEKRWEVNGDVSLIELEGEGE
ncbi:hypothetical protein Tco_0762184 [Tanacetum coccineum]